MGIVKEFCDLTKNTRKNNKILAWLNIWYTMCLVGKESIVKECECSLYFYTWNQIPFRSLLSETDSNQFVGIYGRCNLLLLPTTIYLFSQLCLYISLFISTLCNLLYSLSPILVSISQNRGLKTCNSVSTSYTWI